MLCSCHMVSVNWRVSYEEMAYTMLITYAVPRYCCDRKRVQLAHGGRILLVQVVTKSARIFKEDSVLGLAMTAVAIESSCPTSAGKKQRGWGRGPKHASAAKRGGRLSAANFATTQTSQTPTITNMKSFGISLLAFNGPY